MTRSLASALIMGLFVIPAIGVMAEAQGQGKASDELSGPLASAFRCPAEFRDDLGDDRSPLVFDDGRPVRDADAWQERRKEILAAWHGIMETWPPLIERPGHDPTEASNKQIERFLEHVLKSGDRTGGR